MKLQETINEILAILETKANSKSANHMKDKGATEDIVLGVPQKDLKPLYKKYKNQHNLALELYQLSHIDARSLACMICDLEKMDKHQFNEWIGMTESPWLIDYQISVTLAGHKDGQAIATDWIMSDDVKKMNGGFYAYCWMLGNRSDDQFTDQEIQFLLNKVRNADKVTEAMAYFVEVVGISYLPLYKEALEVANELKLKKAIESVKKMDEKGKLGFKRGYLRC